VSSYAEFTTIVESLLAETNASRVTVRVAGPDGSPDLAAEALAPGVVSMTTHPIEGVVEAPTYRYLADRLSLLVQEDCRLDSIAPPSSLTEVFHVYAQMLAPVVIDGAMVATISVHQQDNSRTWTQEDISALERAQAQVQRSLSERT
jgi:GAF domain-containing protein